MSIRAPANKPRLRVTKLTSSSCSSAISKWAEIFAASCSTCFDSGDDNQAHEIMAGGACLLRGVLLVLVRRECFRPKRGASSAHGGEGKGGTESREGTEQSRA